MTRCPLVSVQLIFVGLDKIRTEIGHLREQTFHTVDNVVDISGVFCFIWGLGRQEGKKEGQEESHFLRLAKNTRPGATVSRQC
jgi:hypothetical protein